MMSNFCLKSILSSLLGSRFFREPIRSRISFADMFRLSPPMAPLTLPTPYLEFGSGLGVLRGLIDDDVEPADEELNAFTPPLC